MVNFKKKSLFFEVVFQSCDKWSDIIRDLFNNDGWSHPLTGTCVEMIRISRNDIAI